MNLVNTVGYQGRNKELRELHMSLINGANILITAPIGYGKTELYSYVQLLVDDYEWFYLELPDTAFATGIKSLIRNYHAKYYDQFYLPSASLNQLADKAKTQIKKTGKLTWSNLTHYIGRTDLETITKILFYSLHWRNQKQPTAHKPILFVKNLKVVTNANMAVFNNLFQQFQVVAILDSRFAHLPNITILTGNFQNVYKLPPIPFDACKSIVIDWLKHNPIEFQSDDVRNSFIKHIARDSGGNVGAIAKLLEESLLNTEAMSKTSVQRLEWEGTKYMSMYSFLMVILAIGSAMRMTGRQLDDPVLIFTGIISGVLLLILFLLRSVIDKVQK